MKKYVEKIILGSTLLAVVACDDSFLTRTPTTDLNEMGYWNTISDLEAYANGIYNEASDNNTYNFMVGFVSSGDSWDSKTRSIYPLEAMSDNFVTVDNSQAWASEIAAGIENVPGDIDDPKYGGWSWGLVRRINIFLENYQRVSGSETLKLQYAGEALFFRAWFYLYMVQNYGDVPLVVEPVNTDSEILYAGRTPRKEVMAQVLKDINDACDYLPVEHWGGNRLTKGAALALKSRIGLYEGTYRKYHGLGDEGDFLDACVEASEELMTMNYQIYNTGNPQSDYTNLFITEDLSNNSEVIFYKKYAPDLVCHRMCGYLVNIRNGGTKDFADDFLCLDSDGQARPVGLSQEYSNDTPEDEFANRDPRMSQIFLAPGTEAAAALFQDSPLGQKCFPRIGNMTNWPTITGYHIVKYYIREQDKKGFGKETHDYPLFRYAEVLLNYAEAKSELGQCDQVVLDKTINVLRDRAGMPHLTVSPAMDPKYAASGLSPLMVEIRRERRVELCFEHLRYQDLMRWAQGEKLKERPLGMRMEDADFENPRYEGMAKKAGTEGAQNPVYVFKAEDGKQYIDPYAGTNYAAERRQFDPARDYLRPIPLSAITKNTNIKQNPGWGNVK